MQLTCLCSKQSMYLNVDTDKMKRNKSMDMIVIANSKPNYFRNRNGT